MPPRSSGTRRASLGPCRRTTPHGCHTALEAQGRAVALTALHAVVPHPACLCLDLNFWPTSSWSFRAAALAPLKVTPSFRPARLLRHRGNCRLTGTSPVLSGRLKCLIKQAHTLVRQIKDQEECNGD